MITASAVDVVYLSKSAGSLWVASGEDLPGRFDGTVTDLVSSDTLRQSVIRIPGSVDCADLIVACASGLPQSVVEICTPTCVVDPDDPDLMVYHLRDLCLPSSLGGWRRVTEVDLAVYRLACHFHLRRLEPNEDTRETFRSHPLSYRLDFIRTLNVDFASQLLALIGHPSWYVNERSGAYQFGRLKSYLALWPRVHWRWLNGCDTPSARKYDVVTRCWYSIADEPHHRSAIGPRDFLWRTWDDKSHSQVQAVLHPNVRFARYVFQQWLDVTCQKQFRGRLFVPEYYFTNRDEIEAYTEHLRNE